MGCREENFEDPTKQNKLVVVSRWFGGQNLGPKRFEYIEAATREICCKIIK